MGSKVIAQPFYADTTKWPNLPIPAHLPIFPNNQPFWLRTWLTKFECRSSIVVVYLSLYTRFLQLSVPYLRIQIIAFIFVVVNSVVSGMLLFMGAHTQQPLPPPLNQLSHYQPTYPLHRAPLCTLGCVERCVILPLTLQYHTTIFTLKFVSDTRVKPTVDFAFCCPPDDCLLPPREFV